MKWLWLAVVAFIIWRALRDVGRRAVARQPDQIHLVAGGSFREAARAENLAAPLRSHGFADVGVFTVREMPGVVIRLLSEGHVAAAVYEHPKAGMWMELFCNTADGVNVTFSSHPATGLEPLPGRIVVNHGGAGPLVLWERFQAERPAGPLEPIGDVVRLFERAYEQSMAQRKARGVTAGEVARVAMRKRS